MSTKSMPGFTAEASLYGSENSYMARYMSSSHGAPNVVPASIRTRGAGTICDSFEGNGWTCYSAGFRTCCCYHPFKGQECFSIE